MELESSDNLEDDQIDMIQEFLKEQAEGNVGMVMVFTIISALQERLTVLVEEMKKEAEDRRLKKEQEEEEAAQKKFEGTRVTIETFMAWKTKFDAERNIKNQLKKEQDRLSKKPTG